MRSLTAAILGTVPLLALIIPEIWRDMFDWLRRSPYWHWIQFLCVIWIILVVLAAIPWPPVLRWAAQNRTLFIALSGLIGAGLFGGVAFLLTAAVRSVPKNLEVQALLFDDAYPDGTDFAGINWLSIDSDVRVNFLNRGRVPLQNLDFEVSFDNAQIKAVGNVDNYPGISVLRSNTSGPDALWLTTSENTAIPAQTSLHDFYRIRCEKVFDNSTIHFAIAVFCVGRPPDDTSNDPLPNKLVRHRPPAIHIKGSYEIASRDGVETRPIDFNHAFPSSMAPDAAAVAATLPRPPTPQAKEPPTATQSPAEIAIATPTPIAPAPPAPTPEVKSDTPYVDAMTPEEVSRKLSEAHKQARILQVRKALTDVPLDGKLLYWSAEFTNDNQVSAFFISRSVAADAAETDLMVSFLLPRKGNERLPLTDRYVAFRTEGVITEVTASDVVSLKDVRLTRINPLNTPTPTK